MKSGCSHFQRWFICKSLPGQKFWEKRNHSAQGKPKELERRLGNPPEKKSYQVEFDFVFVVNILAQSVVATKEVPGRKQQQVIRKWIFLHLAKPGMEGRKGRGG